MPKISELAGAGALTGTEALPVVQSGVTVKATTQAIANLSAVTVADDIAKAAPPAVDTVQGIMGIPLRGLTRGVAPPVGSSLRYHTSGTSGHHTVRKTCIHVEDYGAVGDGVADDTAAIQAAFDAATSPSGFDDYQGSYEVRFPNEGKYKIAGQLSLDSITNIHVKGPAQLHFTSSASLPMLTLLSVAGCTFEDITFSYDSTTFAHNMIQTGHGVIGADTNGLHFLRCRFLTYQYGYGNHNAWAYIRLANAINVHIDGCSFTGAGRGISGYSAAGAVGDPDEAGFANCVSIKNSIFAKLTYASIHNPGECWEISNNNLEPLEGPGFTSISSRGIYQDDLTYFCWAPDIHGNWIGDGGGDPANGWIELRGLGININGNLISGNDPDSVIKIGGSNGVAIVGNTISGRIEFTLPGGNYTTGVFIAGNRVQSAVPYVGEGNIAGMYTRLSNEDASGAQILSRPITIGDYGCTYTRPILTGLKAWPSGGGDPGTIAAGAHLVSGDITVAGVLVGQAIAVGCDVAPPDGVIITANITAASVVRVTIHNLSGAGWTPGVTNFRFHTWS